MARQRLSDTIVADFLAKIGGGEFDPGSPIPPEGSLCTSYGVGRSVVREALQALHAKGFIVLRQGSVATVAPKHRWHVLDRAFLAVTSGEHYFDDLLEARRVLEPQLARLAAARADDSSLREMEDLTAELAVTRDREAHADLDVAFHEAVARSTGNVILISLNESLAGLGHRTRAATALVPGAIDRAVQWHERITEAIRSRDGVAAEAAMTLHLRQAQLDLDRRDYDADAPPTHQGS
jgi:DNA-binding FadR family transcriptional regulator